MIVSIRIVWLVTCMYMTLLVGKVFFWLLSVSVASQETASAIAMLEEQRTRAPSEVDVLGRVRTDGRVWGHLQLLYVDGLRVVLFDLRMLIKGY